VWKQPTPQERYEEETEQTRARDGGGPAPRCEPMGPERVADVQADEDARLADDLATAREAALRLAQKREHPLEPDVRAEIEAALEAERARRAVEERLAAQREQGRTMGGP
jgi:hypothetical protein